MSVVCRLLVEKEDNVEERPCQLQRERALLAVRLPPCVRCEGSEPLPRLRTWGMLNPTCRGPETTVTEDCRVPLREAEAAEPLAGEKDGRD